MAIGGYHLISLYLEGLDFQYWLYIIPLLTLLHGIVTILLFWANRNSLYKKIAFQRFLQVIFLLAFKFQLGFFMLLHQ